MELDSSSVHRKLDSKLKIIGLEANDLILLLLFAAIMNLIFGRTAIAFYVVFLLPACLGVILFLGKRNKPDKFLIHWIRYQITPHFFSAAQEAKYQEKMKRAIYE